MVVAGFEANILLLIDVLIVGGRVAVCSVFLSKILLDLEEVFDMLVHGVSVSVLFPAPLLDLCIQIVPTCVSILL